MNLPFFRYIIIVLGALFAAPFVPEAGARLSQRQHEVKRCLTGLFRARLTQTVEHFSATLDPMGETAVERQGRIQIRSGDIARFAGIRFNFRRTVVRGQRRIIIHGAARDMDHRPSPLLDDSQNRGLLKMVIVKRGNRAKITTGEFAWAGIDRLSFSDEDINMVNDGRLTGHKRLPAKCRH